ncbi:MAG: RNA polymerase sigma-70 factor [Tannerella sp.]|jgi:RNA polymerase sigma-70 factor (ECF subfamily)|nr:RNA polymerase sigma-70 factor [Tannerella sp.]
MNKDINVTDETLMNGVKNNDYVSYNKLFMRYYGRLCQYAYTMLENREDAEDVVQELFLNLWNSRKRMEMIGNVSGYLFKMAKNIALNHIRSVKNYQILLDGCQDVTELYYEENQLETEEFRMALYDCIERLPERSREVLILCRVKGFKQKEISEKLSISVKTIKNQIWTSLRRLRKCLEIKGL